MTKSWLPDWPEERAPHPNRGSLPVGQIVELPYLERSAILSFRHWCSGPAGRETVSRDFYRSLGGEDGGAAIHSFACLIDLLVTGCRRAIMRHDVSCACFGGDESAFANMVALATSGEREDAMGFALVMMTPDAAWQAMPFAEAVGRAFLQIRRAPTAPQSLH